MAVIDRNWSPVTYSDRHGYAGFNFDDKCKAMEFGLTVEEFVEACEVLYGIDRDCAVGVASRSFGEDEPYGVAILGINADTGSHEIYIDIGGAEGYGIIGIGANQCETIERYVRDNNWVALGELGEVLRG